MQILKTVHSKVIALILVSTLLALGSFLATYLLVQTHFGDEDAIEIVHNKMVLLQQLTWLAFSGSNQAEIQSMASEIDQSLKEARSVINQASAWIPFSKPDDIQLNLNSLDASWGTYRRALDSLSVLSLQDTSRLQAEQNLRAETLNMFAQIEALTRALESYSNSRHELLLRLQVVFVIITILGAFLGYVLVRQRVVKPLSILNRAAQRIQKGFLNESLRLAGEDEIAMLASSFNQMREAVLAYETDLEKRIDRRTSEIMTAFEFSQEIVSLHDINALAKSAIAKSRALMLAKNASICLVTPDGRSVELFSTTNALAEGKKWVQPIGDNLPDFAVSSGHSQIYQISHFGCAFLRHTPEDQCLSASLHVGEHVIGAMCVTRDKDQPFSEEESHAFSLLANSAAVAIMNARYQEQTRQKARDAAVLSERERLASELHDNLAQTLNLVNLKVSQLHSKLEQPSDRVAPDDVAVVRTNVQAAIEQVRMLASEMAVATQHHGETFLTKLELRLKEFEEASGTIVEQSGIELPFHHLSDLAQSQLLMIIGEALTNIQRHALAERVALRFRSEEDCLHVTIEDDGKGFQPENISGDQHLGLRIMRTRAERSGGYLNIVSSPGAGTRVTVAFPLTTQEPG